MKADDNLLIACGPVDRRWKRYYKVLTKSMAELTIKKGLNRLFPERISSASPNSYIHTKFSHLPVHYN
ncbi:hypothetical protein L2E82_45291 [Cichorium intybus]|uniref:Uncharacterized protein n=1 Tax=Cichorium intybus TaxID=13427 RepID=A0ACB8ZSG9_CICIN|nr:hypothetical protein L2E82_45291 [Cichorium intybus]